MADQEGGRPSRRRASTTNYVGGDINGGVQDLRQLYTRPAARLNPYSTPLDGVYLCSSSTPPGGGVHGMCGHWAARSALQRLSVDIEGMAADERSGRLAGEATIKDAERLGE